MTNNSVYLEESEVIRLILQFLNSRKLNKSMRNLERESGITNCSFTEDVVFLRQLILDGEWDAILTFAKPLEKLEDFDMKKFRYLILKEKFMEVLYFKSGDEGVSSTYSIEDLVKCLNQLEQDCPFKSDYTKLCWLLTVPDLQETEEYKDWNPETARIKCFREILELLKNVMPVEKRTGNNKISRKPSKDRLINLIIKGLCFESCVDYCHQRAINGQTDDDALSITKDVLGGSLHESTGNFISWLRSLPQESFLAPFEPMSLNIEFKKAEHSRKFHLSNKRLKYEAENLSRSLSLSTRPSTADNAQPSSTTHEIKGTLMTKELNERSQSALATSVKVSNSYGDFHYKGEIGNHNSQLIKTESGSDGSSKVDGRESKNGTGSENTTNKINGQNTGSKNGSTKKNYCENPPSLPLSINDDQNAGKSTQDITSEKPNIVEYDKGIGKSQDSIDCIKNIQESSVLKQLEEHEQRRMELQQELMNGTAPNRVENQRNWQLSCQGQAGDLNELLDNLEAQKEKKTMQSLTKTKSSDTPDKIVSQSDEKIYREAPVGKEVSPNFNDEYVIEAPLHYAVTSTPLAKKKLKPEPLTFDIMNNEAPTGSYLEAKGEGLHDPHQKSYIEDQKENEIQPNNNIQPVNQFVKTPKANVLQPGHWVALKDGSGVMNIRLAQEFPYPTNSNTPKSCREKMSNTPGPPASPVFDHSNQEPAVNSTVHPVTDVKQDVGYRSAGDYEERDLQYEENIAADVDENPPVRRGPKINGVRRSLVSTGPPMSRNKSSVTPPEERREAKTPRQERPTSKNLNKDLKGKTNGMSSPRDQKQVPARKSSKEETGNGKKRNSGITFVVDKDAPSGTANLTYQKPTSQLPVSSISEPKSTETTRLLERQKQHLMSNSESIRFSNVASLEDVQAVRAVAFHPSGDLFGIGSNSKTLRVCSASGLSTYKKMESGSDLIAPQPTILFKRNRHHKGSIYCIAWNNSGDLIATGSNDKSIKVLHFDAENCTQIGPEMEMNIHSGTVRDLAFASRSGGSNVLVSGGAGSGNILISDSSTGNTVGQLRGHSSHIMSVFAAKDDIIASGSNDNTVRLWDLRSHRCIDVIATGDSCVASVCVSPNCSLLSSGHEDGGCMIYDITAGRTLQFFKPHTQDCRSVRFSPSGHHLLTGSYDTSIILLDMQNNLDCNIPPYSVVAQHKDKVIQCRWHPYLMAFVTSSADKTAVLWTLDC